MDQSGERTSRFEIVKEYVEVACYDVHVLSYD